MRFLKRHSIFYKMINISVAFYRRPMLGRDNGRSQAPIARCLRISSQRCKKQWTPRLAMPFTIPDGTALHLSEQSGATMRQRTKQEQLCDGHHGRGLIRHLCEGMLHSEALFAWASKTGGSSIAPPIRRFRGQRPDKMCCHGAELTAEAQRARYIGPGRRCSTQPFGTA
jgi:hypothetical protein